MCGRDGLHIDWLVAAVKMLVMALARLIVVLVM